MAELIQQLLGAFRDAAIRKGHGPLPAQLDHQLHEQMAEAFWKLQDLGDPGAAAFRSLLQDDSPHVRAWVAAQLLANGDSGARFVLEALKNQDGLVGFGASMVLEEFAKGRLASPFGERGA